MYSLPHAFAGDPLFVLTYPVADLTLLREFCDAHNMPLLPLLVAVPLSIGIAYVCVWIGKLMRMSEFLKRWCYGLRNTRMKE